MKTFSRSLPILLSFFAMTFLAGCGGSSGPTSMAEDVELSEIEAYEKSLLEMEAEDAGGMEMDGAATE